MASIIRRAVALWLPVAGATSVLAFTIYAGVQQVQRSDADDPQLQMARDTAAALNAGATPDDVVPQTTVDVATSASPWLAVYDRGGAAIASSGTFEGHAPELPDDVIAQAVSEERTFSWEPRDGLRFATVATPYRDGVVVAARSLAEVEHRESVTLAIAGLGLVAALVAAAAGALLGVWIRDRDPAQRPH